MSSFVEKLIFRSGEDPSSPSVRDKAGERTGVFGILCNILLCAVKLTAGLAAGSISILADALNNLTDAVSSVVTMAGFHISAQKPDKEHPYGHGRVEYIAGLLVSFFILITGIELLQNSVSKIFHPAASQITGIILVLLGISVLVKGFMAFVYGKAAVLLHSRTVKASMSDSLSDMAATGVVFVSMLAEKLTGVIFDGWSGTLISLFILYEGLSAFKDTLQPVLGTPSDPEEQKKIRNIVCEDPRILGIHDLVIHDYGPDRQMISLHAELNADTSFQEAHEAADSAEKRLEKALGCSAVIHMDPIAMQDTQTRLLMGEVHNMAHRISAELSEDHSPDSITVHDLRLVHSSDSTRLIFDVLIPYGMSEKKVREAFEKQIRSLTGHYTCSIHIDHPL